MYGTMNRRRPILFYSSMRRQRKRSVRCLIFLLTVQLFFVLNVYDYSPVWAGEEEEKEEPKNRWLTRRINTNPDYDFKFEPGSAIQLTIWQEPDLSGDFSIDSQGYVILPLIGKINVERFTPESLEGYLQQEYSSYLRNPIIQTLPLIRISVVGYVQKPGHYRVEPDRPLWDVVAMAGGPTHKGDVSQLYVSRRGNIINENLLVAYEDGISLREVGIISGDQVVIPSEKGPFPWRMMISIASLGVSIWAISTRI
jgi:polysaccharide export outer membrane protein